MSESDIVKVSWYIATNKVGSECRGVAEFDREEWESMSDSEKEEVVQEVAFEWMEWSWEVVEG